MHSDPGSVEPALALPDAAPAATPEAAPAAADPLPTPTGEHCGNCGAVLFGAHCYRCGQPDHGLVRHFSSIMGDLADTVLQIDTRLTRTLTPLMLRPGYLTTEYFAGRRVRYVSPVRLFFFFSVLAFLVAQWSVGTGDARRYVQLDDGPISNATTVEQVVRQRDLALDGLRQAQQVAAKTPAQALTQDVARDEAKLRRQADQRIAEIEAAQAAGKPPPEHAAPLTFGDGKPWDPQTNPIAVRSLPAFANRWLNHLAIQARGNLVRIRKDPTLLVDAWLSAVPSTLFVLLPLFALLLKCAYVFKRHLYMEHFIVALHSHAFLCLALLLVVLTGDVAATLPQGTPRTVLDMLETALLLWMPVYLWLMQKRVYGQGWLVTTLKFCAIGFLYFILLTFGAAITFMVKLVWL
ncbi:MAG: DUF3667 domain-containing protein [Proteobacteria bacterium]|nr:DUF3667 domain-containing protein [Pseudomonadota bacterium]